MASQPPITVKEASLLRTKLYVPAPRGKLVARPRLIERLNTGLFRKLSLISAPVGFGKTTLVGNWIRALSRAPDGAGIAWVSLDKSDNELTRFLAYVVAALQTAVPDLAEGMLRSLLSSRSPPAEEVLIELINEIAAGSGRLVLVLDDYHLIETPSIHDALAFLLRHLPQQMHLVISTREDPPLPLSRLRARGQLTELRAADLRFTQSEVVAFLNQAMGLDLPVDDMEALERRTEGWIAGLQLAAISMQGRQDAAGFVQSFTGSHRFVLDYLLEEVLDQQPERVQAFLLQTAFLDRLTGSLCDALTGQDDGQATLESLEHANLFVVPLDNERQWYRYHHLFADLLQQRLRQARPDQIAVLHQRASAWYEQQDLPAQAIHHALAAGDVARAAALAELAWPRWSVSFRSIRWLGWVKGLPDAVVRARPVLSMAYAWAFLNAGRLEEAEARLEDVERWLASGDGASASSPEMVVVDEAQFRALPASLATARAYHAQAAGESSAAVAYVSRALDLLPEDDCYTRASVTGFLGLAYWAEGDLEAAHRIFCEGLFQNDHDAIQGAFVVADMELTLGRLREAVRTCDYALRLAERHGEPLGTEDVYTGIGELHRQMGALELASRDLARARELGEAAELPDWEHRWCVAQARLNESLGDLDGALALLDRAERLYVRTPVPLVRPIAALRTRVWVRQGRLAEAADWARQQGLAADDDLSFRREFDHVTLARVRIAQSHGDRKTGTLDAALALLARLVAAAETGGRTGAVIEMLVLEALAWDAQGQTARALDPLGRALALAEPEGFVQVFVDEGSPLAQLLREAVAHGVGAAYARRLLTAFSGGQPAPRPAPVTRPAATPLVEPLSERELEVLQLVAEGMTNPEIALRLYVTLNTVKVHTRNIYGKLAVHNRTQAVVRGRELGILPEY